ncbi:MAG: 30S ribosomal protein S3Ae [Methanosaeta sp. PtaB.Bin039]|nr:MAG: 30S ribosomal protein S3Ae [Methanosaeta sp. PtaB.Bin039]HOT07297.1 30S ribosomal protein S3ae [Methanotrichaceae archaeon]HQF15822.1 30S ribosomal protein S3ae [Methanotrichaceae archaeon]HQI90502.1 30S ribosomal protein S3ae [Methanotrichaceae archaeon]HQJ28109.1 30S ribosomal protein S3ae [Methanotrichaceae archaeon]
MARRSQRKSERAKVKQWFKVIGPEMFGRSPVGETIANDPSKLVGRIIETTLGDLTNNFSKQNTKLRFKVDKVAGDSAYTKFVGHEMTTDYIRSLVKRRTSRIDSIVDVVTTDGYQVRVKPSCFTVKRARANQVKTIRDLARQVVLERGSTLDLNGLIQEVVLGKLSLDIYKEAKAIYPLRRVEVRKTQIMAEPASAASGPVAPSGPAA